MKWKYIIMDSASVVATFAGKKTMTRRVVPWKPYHDGDEINSNSSAMSLGHYCTGVPESGHVLYSRGHGGCWNQRTKPVFPKYQIGDGLYVKETFADLRPANLITVCGNQIIYKSSNPQYERTLVARLKEMTGKGWTPARYMPKLAARLFIRITNVRVEWLHQITDKDVLLEGLSCLSKDNGTTYKYGLPDLDGLPGNDNFGWHWSQWESSPIKAFEKRWNALNAERGHEFSSNPAVFVYEYKLEEVTFDGNEFITNGI